MKNLKLKSILFSLMAIAMVTVFLSSCEQDIVETPTNLEALIDNTKMPEGHLATKLDLKDKTILKKGH